VVQRVCARGRPCWEALSSPHGGKRAQRGGSQLTPPPRPPAERLSGRAVRAGGRAWCAPRPAPRYRAARPRAARSKIGVQLSGPAQRSCSVPMRSDRPQCACWPRVRTALMRLAALLLSSLTCTTSAPESLRWTVERRPRCKHGVSRRATHARPARRSHSTMRGASVPYHSALRARALPQPYPSALHARRVLRHLRALGQRPVPHPGGAARAHVRQRARGHVRAADAVAAQHHAARQVHLPVRPRACQPSRLHGRQTAVFRVVAGSSAWAGCGASVPAELHAAVCGQRICLLPRHGSAGPSGAAPRANTGRGCWVGVGGWGVGGDWGGWRGLDVPQVWRALVAPGTAACGPV